MKNLKILTGLLALFSLGALAQGELIETIPDFYYIEEVDEGETSVFVHVCHGRVSRQKRGCSVVLEVERNAINQFGMDLARELHQLAGETVSEENINDRYALVGGAGVIASTFGFWNGIKRTAVAVANKRFYLLGGKRSFRVRHAFHSNMVGNIIIFTLSSVTLAVSADLVFGQALDANASINKNLLNQIRRQGIVGGNSEHYPEILQRFTDFLNQYGRPVSN